MTELTNDRHEIQTGHIKACPASFDSYQYPMTHNGISFVLLPQCHQPTPVVLPPSEIIHAPLGTYGIALEFFPDNIQDPLPGGWAE